MEHVLEHPDAGMALAQATVRASLFLGMNEAILARTLGLREPAVALILNSEKPINPESKEGELALLLVRLHLSLNALVGADDRKWQFWMEGYNKALEGVPLQLIQRVDGLVTTLAYLDSMRASR
ncbi:antitoxin Xre/MbcA/ParS toxin-binding domain-containing protein [Curvibacter lanceolatus]|uniref:antitoxin Xre/MbcA/ParS toxin-binding domain-containing protein n=1 Tax=Curvibacter lanceolatus TaxID=86182 RepID=UPI0004CF4E8E|nr:antitoxin Xre/MbcA/ParS toxin-binding domain-containing protein [Curvibacter lanceolatus]